MFKYLIVFYFLISFNLYAQETNFIPFTQETNFIPFNGKIEIAPKKLVWSCDKWDTIKDTKVSGTAGLFSGNILMNPYWFKTCVSDEAGVCNNKGGYLKIELNERSKFPATVYSYSAGIRDRELKPGQTEIIMLAIYVKPDSKVYVDVEAKVCSIYHPTWK